MCISQVLSMRTLATLAMGSACSVSWKAICRAGSFVSFAAALKLSKASRYCPAQAHLLTHKILTHTRQCRCHLFAITRGPLATHPLGLGHSPCGRELC